MRLGPIGKGSEMLQSRFRSILIPSLGCNINIKPTARTMRIYTKTGDKGTTGLYSGERLPKNHAIFEALGANDELTSHIGLSMQYCKIEDPQKLEKLTDQLASVQSRLQDLNSHIATLEGANTKRFKATRFDPNGEETARIESWIDEYDAVLPPLKNFILPGGGLAGASLHVARTVCRRAERRVQQLVSDGVTDAPPAIYLNRLSDYLFMAARFATWSLGHSESIYKKAQDQHTP